MTFAAKTKVPVNQTRVAKQFRPSPLHPTTRTRNEHHQLPKLRRYTFRIERMSVYFSTMRRLW
jgi:hypothetical protein